MSGRVEDVLTENALILCLSLKRLTKILNMAAEVVGVLLMNSDNRIERYFVRKA